jgi:membrane-bound lytic murein transglycosylase B
MTALILKVTPLVEKVAPKLQAVYRRFLHALDDFVEKRMHHAVPERVLRKAHRDINRSPALIHRERKSPRSRARVWH